MKPRLPWATEVGEINSPILKIFFWSGGARCWFLGFGEYIKYIPQKSWMLKGWKKRQLIIENYDKIASLTNSENFQVWTGQPRKKRQIPHPLGIITP